MRPTPAMKFIRIETNPLVAIVTFGDGEERWNAQSLQMRLENLIFDGYEHDEEDRALRAIRQAGEQAEGSETK